MFQKLIRTQQEFKIAVNINIMYWHWKRAPLKNIKEILYKSAFINLTSNFKLCNP